MDPTKCKEKVYPSERWGSFHGHQCHKNIWKDGYCKQHHPDTVEARHEAREKVWKQKIEKDPILLLQKATKKIEELERQLASSTEIREAEKKILIQEIEKNKELENRIKEFEKELENRIKELENQIDEDREGEGI
jgi:Zn-dependent M32 family carboxypeptidase